MALINTIGMTSAALFLGLGTVCAAQMVSERGDGLRGGAPDHRSPPVTGYFGGYGVGLVLGSNGGRVDYDCAAGAIDQSLRLGRDGRFDVRGHVTPGHGGPARLHEHLPSYPAQYAGRGSLDALRFTVRRSDGAPPQSYYVVRNQAPQLHRCL